MHFLREAYRISVRRGCGLLMQSRTVYHWQSRRDDRAITLRIREIAETRIRYGCPRIHIQLRREGWPVNRKHTGFTVWKASTCAKSAPAGMSVQHIVSNVRS